MENKLLFSQRGGVSGLTDYGISAYYNPPLAKISLFKNKIIIECGIKNKVELKKKDIINIKYKRGLLGGFLTKNRIEIYTKKLAISPSIEFSSFSMDTLVKELKKAGY